MLMVCNSGSPKAKGGDPKLNRGNPRERRVGFWCQAGRLHHDGKPVPLGSEDRKCKTASIHPSDASLLCPFRLAVFLVKEGWEACSHRWCLSAQKKQEEQSGIICQHVHHHKFPAMGMHAPLQLMKPEEKKLAKGCCQLRLASASQAELLTLRNTTGFQWKKAQVDCPALLERKAAHGLGADAPTADKLVASFGKR
jgi:hypothetical protein